MCRMWRDLVFESSFTTSRRATGATKANGNSNTSGVADVSSGYGLAGDRPVAGDWNNDGRDTEGIARAAAVSSYCPAGGMTWKLSDTLACGATRVYGYGCWNDRVVVGDWNNNGTDTAGVGRRS